MLQLPFGLPLGLATFFCCFTLRGQLFFLGSQSRAILVARFGSLSSLPLRFTPRFFLRSPLRTQALAATELLGLTVFARGRASCRGCLARRRSVLLSALRCALLLVKEPEGAAQACQKWHKTPARGLHALDQQRATYLISTP